MSDAFEAVTSVEEPEDCKAEEGEADDTTDDTWGEQEGREKSAGRADREGGRDGRASHDGARVRASSVVAVFTVARVAQLSRRQRYLVLSPLHAQRVETSAEVARGADSAEGED